jgi:hypothetical protein
LFLSDVEKSVLTLDELEEQGLPGSNGCDVEKPVLAPYKIEEDFLVLALVDIEKSVLILGQSKLGESVLTLALVEESVLRGGYSWQSSCVCFSFMFPLPKSSLANRSCRDVI